MLLLSVLISTQYPLQCFFPYFIGDGDDCTVDEDGDGFPNVPLEICTQLNNTNASYCIQVSYTRLFLKLYLLVCWVADSIVCIVNRADPIIISFFPVYALNRFIQKSWLK